MFEIKNVSKKYGSEYAIKNLNLQIGKGLNFIIGASGSGKTTLLKMISGMDNQFEGEILYLGQSIKNLNDSQKAYYYNNKFGFVYQDFNLIEDMTVEENIMLPLYIKNVSVKYEIEKVLRKLNISKLRNTKVKLLSGGQKQRVAIARELVKNPQVIIADEPTSALDPKTALEVINILKDISKERMVIIVTHDTSLIDKKSKVYELDKGELISKPEDIESQAVVSKINSQKKFKLSNAFEVGIINNKSKLARSFVTCLSMLVSTVLLMTSVSGSVSKGGEESFNKLFEDYGKSILDISIVKSFTGGASTGEDGNENPNVDVTQDISGIYDKYIEDERVDYILFVKAFNNIDISVDGKEYKIESSGTVPSLNNILVGDVPKNKGEVLVPESFIKKLGLSNEKAIGKEIDFSGSIYNWDSGEPEIANVNTKAKIVGISDSKMKSVFEGNTYEFELEDAFFFDKDTLSEINKQAGIKANNHDLQMRVKTPQDLIAVKDALNAKGIVPIGQFELVEDIVRLDSQTNNLSKGSSLIIGCLAICSVIAIALVSANMRKREYAIYKVCGYSKSQLSLVLFAESSIAALISATSLVILSPVISILTKTAFGTSITNINTLVIGVVITVGTSCICYFIASIIGKSTDPLIVLKSGGR